MKGPKNIPPSIRKEIHERDKGICQKCGRNGHHIHHIINANMGGRRIHSKFNLITLCVYCHVHSLELDKFCFAWSRERYGDKIDQLARKTGRRIS